MECKSFNEEDNLRGNNEKLRKTTQAEKLMFESRTKFLLTYIAKDGTCRMVTAANYEELWKCVTGAMIRFVVLGKLNGYSDDVIINHLNHMTEYAFKVAKEKVGDDEEE